MIAKPNHIFDRDWEWEGLTGFVTSPSPDVILGVVSGRRRQGKTYLLDALADATGGGSAGFRLDTWDDAVRMLFDVVPQGLIVLDEFPFMMRANRAIPSLLQRELGPQGAARRGGQTRILLCGSAMSVMGKQRLYAD